ncbi:hypothetical protein ACLESD_52760, partial [Pyxidicoccus sp. 3LFB2]
NAAPAPVPKTNPAEDDSDLLAPLPAPKPPAAKQAEVKRPPPAPKKVRVAPPRGKEATPLQREWRETNALYNKLRSKHSCLPLGPWCLRYQDIRNEVEAAGDVNDADTLGKVKEMKRQLQAIQRELD